MLMKKIPYSYCLLNILSSFLTQVRGTPCRAAYPVRQGAMDVGQGNLQLHDGTEIRTLIQTYISSVRSCFRNFHEKEAYLGRFTVPRVGVKLGTPGTMGCSGRQLRGSSPPRSHPTRPPAANFCQGRHNVLYAVPLVERKEPGSIRQLRISPTRLPLWVISPQRPCVSGSSITLILPAG